MVPVPRRPASRQTECRLSAVWKALALSGLLLAAGCAQPTHASAPALPPPPMLVFMTDYGLVDDSVAICKGVMLSVAPDARIVDLTHDVRAYSILDSARYLAGTAPYFPAGTVFVAVVDPGVGSARKSMIAKSNRGQYFVLPDNGLITMVADQEGLVGVREITNPAFMSGRKMSSTFHGRDIYSAAGAHLVRGDDWTGAGPPIDTPVRLNLPKAVLDERGLTGTIIGLDGPFGNLVTNVASAQFADLGYEHGQQARVTVGTTEMTLPFVRTFSDVAEGAELLYIDSRDRLALAINMGNFAEKHGVKPPTKLVVARKKR